MNLINNQYKVVELLKEDKYGSEYLVKDLYKDGMIKRLRVIDFTAETKEFIDYMKINFYDYKNIIHPNITKFYFFNRIRFINAKPVVSNKFYYTYEHNDSVDLFTYTKDKSFDHLLDIAGQLCAAFNYIHLRGMLFYNVNGSKLHITKDKNDIQLKVSAFPYKKFVSEQILMYGDDLYFKAPEVIQYSKYTRQSDIYMIGVILFHIFTGMPIKGASFKERLEKSEYKTKSKLHSMMKIIKKCTLIDASERYNTVLEIIDDINSIFNKSFNIIDKKYIETLPIYPTSLVGREKYIRYITENIYKSFYDNGKVKVAIITGEPGTGKGAFLRSLQYRVFQEDEEPVYLSLNNIPYVNYYGITEIIKKLIKHASKELIDKYKDSLCYIMPEIIQEDEYISFLSDHEKKDKHKLIYRLGNFILESSIEQHFVFIIKGFEFLDQDSREILYYVIRNGGRSKLFFVISFKNDMIKREVKDKIKGIIGEESIIEINLSNLNINETTKMVENLLGIDDVPIDFIAQIYKETDGNPYLVHEIIDCLYTDKHIYVNDKGRWVFDNVDLSKLNLNINPDEMLQNKVNKFEPNKREMLNIISIFNSAVPLDVLGKMMDMNLEEISYISESLVSSDILSRKMDDWGISVDFNSITLKRNIYSRLDDFTRYKYHDKASRILEEKFSTENRENKDELIFHMTKSGRCNEAIDYLVASAEKMAKKGLIKQAIQFLEQGYGYFPDNNVCSQKLDICLKLGDLYYKMCETKEALNYYNCALEGAERIDSKVFAADSHIRLVRLFYRINDIKSCLKHSAIAKRIIKDISYRKGMLDLLLYLSDLMIYRRKYNSYMKIIIKVLKSIDASDKYYWAMFKSVYGRILTKKNSFEEALRHLEESSEVLEQLEEYEGLVISLNSIGTIYSDYFYDIEKASEYFEKNLYICQKINDLSLMSYSYNNLAEMSREKDKYKESLEYYKKALEVINKVNNKYSEIMIYINKSLVNLELEDYKQSLECIKKAEKILSKSKDIGEAIRYYYIYKANIYYRIGYLQKAIAYAQKSVDMCIKWGWEVDPEALYIIKLCKSVLYKKLDYKEVFNFIKELFHNRKYKLGRRACHSFAELFIEHNKLEEAKGLLDLSAKYSKNINSENLERFFEYLNAMVCTGNERKEKLTLLTGIHKSIGSNSIKWKMYKSLGQEFYREGEYHEALKCFISSLNALRMLVEGVPNQHKIKFLLSHRRYTVKEYILKSVQHITGKHVLHGTSLLCGEIKDMRNRMAEYFDNKIFKDIVRRDSINKIKNDINLDKGLMTSFIIEFITIIKSFTQNTENNIDSLIRMLMELTQAKNGFLAIFDEDNNIKMLSSQLTNENQAFYKYIIEQVRQKGESVVITDAFEYRNNTKDNIIPDDICAVFCIPVFWHRNNEGILEERRKQKEPNQISGYIYLDTDSIINNFTKDTCKICESMSKLLQVLIENYNLKKISGIDKLTGLYTRKYFEMVLQNEIYINSSIKGEFSIIMTDIDKFKQINDRFGHQKGDDVLQKVAEIVLDTVRKSDICARYGGEEFIILLPGTSSEGAYNLAEKIRQKVEKAKLLGYHNPVTISLGIASYPVHSSWMKDLIDKADQALYHSKENGRNMTTVFDINMIRTVNRVNKLAGIISGNMVDDQRNVETMLEIMELQRNYRLSLYERLSEFLGKAIEISEADIGYILVLDKNKEIKDEIFKKNVSKKNVDNINYNKNVIQETIDSKSGKYFIDWTGNAPIDPATGIPNWQSKMVIPFVYGEKIYAVLYLSVELKKKEFDANIYNFMTRLCEIITPIFCLETDR